MLNSKKNGNRFIEYFIVVLCTIAPPLGALLLLYWAVLADSRKAPIVRNGCVRSTPLNGPFPIAPPLRTISSRLVALRVQFSRDVVEISIDQ